MVPAVWRMMAARPSATSPRTVRNRPPPMTARSTSCWTSVAVGVEPDRIDWPTKNAVNDTASVTTRATMPKTIALAAKHHGSPRDRREGGPDRARPVFGAHGEPTEHAHGELPEEEPGEADAGGVEQGLVDEVGVAPMRRLAGGGEDADADAEHHRGDQAPQRGAHRAQLRPFRAQRAGEPVVPGRQGSRAPGQ